MKDLLNYIKSIIKNRELLKYFIHTDLKLIYKHKLLGFLWTILDPLLMMFVYLLLVTVIFKRGGPQFPILLFTGLLVWQWFTYSLTRSVTSISKKAKLIQSINFSKIVLPLGPVFVGMINLFLGLIVLVPFLLIFEAKFTYHLFWFPSLLLIQLVFTIGAVLICATVGVYLHDLQNIIKFLLKISFYISPVIYSIENRIPENIRVFYLLNPFAVLINSYKNVLIRGLPPNPFIGITIGVSLLILIIGTVLFYKKESIFSKEV